jgi:hypothetical protein
MTTADIVAIEQLVAHDNMAIDDGVWCAVGDRACSGLVR